MALTTPRSERRASTTGAAGAAMSESPRGPDALASPTGIPIRFEEIKRRDGTPVIYLDGDSVVEYLYGEGESLVLELHRRTDDAGRRLRVLLDGAAVVLLPIAAQFTTVATQRENQQLLTLVCGLCNRSLTELSSPVDLRIFLGVAASHSCLTAEGEPSCR